MSLLFRSRYMFAYETTPSSSENPSGETTPASSESGGGSQESGFLSRDDFDRFQQSVNERFDQFGQQFDGFGQQITEGFGWLRENLGSRPADAGEQDSQSENPQEPTETVIEVQDRQTVRNKRPRTRLNLGSLFR